MDTSPLNNVMKLMFDEMLASGAVTTAKPNGAATIAFAIKTRQSPASEPSRLANRS